MPVTIVKVENNRQLKRFVKFGFELYKDCPYYVPELFEDAMNTLRKDRNAAFEFCDADYFLAYKDGVLAGRIAVLVNKAANEKWGQNAARFGWIDFIDDNEVVDALFATAEQWARERGLTELQGPLGFTDLDREGMLIEGFDRLGTMATIYNYPYYPEHMNRLGFVKDADWVEYLLKVPNERWAKAERISAIVERKFGLRVVHCNSRSELAKRYGSKLFELVNECYAPLYGFTPLTRKQIDQFIKMYLPVIDLRLISLVVDADDNLVALGVSIYSLADALRKAKGKLFPFGWWYLLKALFIKHPKRLDFLLVAVKPEYQSKGAFAMVFNDLLGNYLQMDLVDVESNPELETNTKVQSQWNDFEKEQHKRRRAFRKELC
ncbi:MAG: N-acetyltransferase [Alistipes sp.]|nr:N-acetyltransferase [Alistipes sp.]MBR3941676.1 N-acetyltransferase [Bacteroidaceae bacterium]